MLLLAGVKGPTFDQKGSTFRLCHGTQRQNWKVQHAQKGRGARSAPRLFCGRWTFQFCLCVPWHRRKVGPFWSKVGPLTAASRLSAPLSAVEFSAPLSESQRRRKGAAVGELSAPLSAVGDGKAVLPSLVDLVVIFCSKIDQNGRPGRREPPQSISFEKL